MLISSHRHGNASGRGNLLEAESAKGRGRQRLPQYRNQGACWVSSCSKGVFCRDRQQDARQMYTRYQCFCKCFTLSCIFHPLVIITKQTLFHQVWSHFSSPNAKCSFGFKSLLILCFADDFAKFASTRLNTLYSEKCEHKHNCHERLEVFIRPGCILIPYNSNTRVLPKTGLQYRLDRTTCVSQFSPLKAELWSLCLADGCHISV